MRLLWIFLAALGSISHASVIQLPSMGVKGETLALHCVEPPNASAEAVLFIHGASFPTMLAAGFEFGPKDSWMEFMASRGFLACGLDFLGFGASSRPPSMQIEPLGGVPVDKAADAALQISVAVEYLRMNRGISHVHIVAHSWGTIPAALYVATHPSTSNSLTLFGPIVPKPGSLMENTAVSWWSISAQERFEQLKFVDVLPRGVQLLEGSVTHRWAGEFAASGSGGKSQDIHEQIRIPAGPLSDTNAALADHYPYRPKDIQVPVFIVYGSCDFVIDDKQAQAFLSRFTASPLKWRLRIDRGTHVMHLEENRKSLYQSVLGFIAAVGSR